MSLITHCSEAELWEIVERASRGLYGGGKYLYALVEPGMLEGSKTPVPSGLAQHFAAPGQTSLYARRHEHVAASIGPMILRPEMGQAEWLWEHAQPRYGVSWMFSEQPLDELAQHFAQWLDAKTADGLRFMLRFYDPRLAEPLLTMLGKDALAGLLPPGESWAWLDPWHRGCVLQPLPYAGTPPELVLDETQVDTLMRLSEAGPLLDVLQQRVPGLLRDWTQPSAYALASHLATVAQEHGLDAFDRKFSYALDALEIHPQVHQSELVRDRIKQGVALDAVLENLTQDERETLTHTLRQQWPPVQGEAA